MEKGSLNKIQRGILIRDATLWNADLVLGLQIFPCCNARQFSFFLLQEQFVWTIFRSTNHLLELASHGALFWSHFQTPLSSAGIPPDSQLCAHSSCRKLHASMSSKNPMSFPLQGSLCCERHWTAFRRSMRKPRTFAVGAPCQSHLVLAATHKKGLSLFLSWLPLGPVWLLLCTHSGCWRKVKSERLERQERYGHSRKRKPLWNLKTGKPAYQTNLPFMMILIWPCARIWSLESMVRFFRSWLAVVSLSLGYLLGSNIRAILICNRARQQKMVKQMAPKRLVTKKWGTHLYVRIIGIIERPIRVDSGARTSELHRDFICFSQF